MKGWPDVDVIVVNWNGKPFLQDCLSSILAQDYAQLSAVLVDNASTDGSVEWVREHFPQVQALSTGQNAGFAAGANAGLRRSTAEIAVTVNPDVIVSPNWLRNLVAPMLADETIAIAGCKLYYPGGRVLQHAGGYITWPLALPGHYGLREEDTGQHDLLRDVDYVIGAAMAMRREAVARIGLFDEGYFLYFEDADLCARAWQAGFRVVYVPGATLVHVESALAVKGSLAYLRNMHASRWRFLLKHCPLDGVVGDTLPAERAYLDGCGSQEREALASAYEVTLENLPAIWAARRRDGGPGMSDVSQEQKDRIRDGLGSLREQSQAPVPAAGAQEQPAAAPPGDRPAEWQVRERPFVSQAPIAGPLIARFREAWNSVSTKWYVRPIVEQQNEINRRLVAEIQRQQAEIEWLRQELTAAHETLAALDREAKDARRLQSQALYERWEERAEDDPEAHAAREHGEAGT